MGKKVARTRNNAEWTEAQFWGHIRSALRKASRYWKPSKKAKLDARRAYKGKNKRQKFEYKCCECKKWFTDKETQVDHIVPAGSLKSYDDIAGFVERLFTESGYQVMCKECHKIKTTNEKNERKG